MISKYSKSHVDTKMSELWATLKFLYDKTAITTAWLFLQKLKSKAMQHGQVDNTLD
jgi:hypothetical protein